MNDKLVVLRQQSATGRQIKENAIKQDVHIHLEDQLWEELGDGAVKAVADDEEVSLRHHHHFTATPHESHPKIHTISVNEMPVKIKGHSATGAEIKAAAIAQGVLIKQELRASRRTAQWHEPDYWGCGFRASPGSPACASPQSRLTITLRSAR